MQFKGIDLSHHQTTDVNFYKMKELGFEYVMLRAGYGKIPKQKDKNFEYFYKQASNAGLKVGAYHYSYAVSVQEAKEEARCFLGWISDKKLQYPVAYDIEDKSQKTMSKSKRTDIALTWLEEMEHIGLIPMLYSSASWLGKRFDLSRLNSYDIWCACYTDKNDIKKYYNGKIDMWQYSSSIVIPEIYHSRLDHNISYKDYAEITLRRSSHADKIGKSFFKPKANGREMCLK